MSQCVSWREICQHLGRSHADREGEEGGITSSPYPARQTLPGKYQLHYFHICSFRTLFLCIFYVQLGQNVELRVLNFCIKLAKILLALRLRKLFFSSTIFYRHAKDTGYRIQSGMIEEKTQFTHFIPPKNLK